MGIALVLILGIFSAGVAGATVIYQWQEVFTPSAFTPSGGTITIDGAAWGSGALVFGGSVEDQTPPGPDGSFPNSPIIRFDAYNAYITPRNYMGPFYYWGLTASLTFDQQTGLMLGDLFVRTSYTDLTMSSGADGLWTINYYITDADQGGPCGGELPFCSGATGRWVFYSVPEPSEIPIFALGLILIGLGLSGRFSSSSRHVSRKA